MSSSNPAPTTSNGEKSLMGEEPLNSGRQDEASTHSILLRASTRAVDVLSSVCFFIGFSWLYGLIAIGVLLSSGRPILYTQPRLGKNGRVFRFYKFRSMVPDAHGVLDDFLKGDPIAQQQWSDFQKLTNDPRITRFGSLIRKTSLDELPQFWNVLRGDMSLVGPRPCMINQKKLYGSSWKHYCAVRPGITGLWQVSGRNKLSYQERVALDSEYVESMSVKKDLTIFIRTLWVVVTGHGSH
jgi:exopolysaccharide production protein ExoY